MGGSLVFAIAGESTGWNPSVDRWGQGPMTVARALFDPLVITASDGSVHPYLAESFTPLDGARTWNIKIREGMKFTNGEPVDGHAVVYNLRTYQESPLTGSAFKPVREIEKDGDLGVKVTLDQPWPNFPAMFTGQAGFIIAPEQLRAKESQRPIGSGPFTVKEWQRDAKLIATKNAGYWRVDGKGRRLPYLDEVKFLPMPDETSRREALAAGNIDVTHSNSPLGVSRLVKDGPPPGFSLILDDSEGEDLSVPLNTQTGPFTDTQLRKAAQLATDRRAIAGHYGDVFPIADGPFTDHSPWWADPGWPEPDIEGARRLVDQYKSAHGGEAKVVLVTVAAPDWIEIAQLIQQQWQAAGFDVSIRAEEETKLSGTLVSGAFDAITIPFWIGEDPDVNFHFWTGRNVGPPGGISLNFPRYANAEVDAALDTGRAEADPKLRKVAYATVWRRWAEDVPYLWIFHSKWAVVYRNTFHGLSDVPLVESPGRAQAVTGGAVTLTSTWSEAARG